MPRRRTLLLMAALLAAPPLLPRAGNAAQAPARRPPAPPRPPRAPKPLVVIDPGHGGKDPGAIGVSGTHEKRIVLAACLDLKRTLERGGKLRVAMTRANDRFVPLEGRVRFAQARGAALFVSVHADATESPAVRGASVYTLSAGASDRLADSLARRENRSDRFGMPDFQDVNPEVARILASLVRRETATGSVRLARKLVAEFDREPEVGLLGNPHRKAGFVVLQAPDIPSVLVEMGFMSNRLDESKLRKPEYRRKLVAAMSRAIHAQLSAATLGTNTTTPSRET
ncbi:MAG: N-acetylmuramoyl-L-alanine amidase [Acetobacteraceae bacterium]|nr:N-acetylmuramoyl-L-alanine amidase [Acetobacteraceae bacterium]